jgi:hypothetical protein
MAGDNHRVPPAELALLPYTLAKAPAGSRCGDCCRTAMDGRADGARHALCQLRPWSLACQTAVGEVFSLHLSNHDSRLTVATRSWRTVGRVPKRPGWSHVAAVALHSAIGVM